jgi:hypothetical protein
MTTGKLRYNPNMNDNIGFDSNHIIFIKGELHVKKISSEPAANAAQSV